MFEPKLSWKGITFKTIETHTMGEPTRIITSGFPALEGETMMQRKQFLEQNYDHYRSALMLEPRGHKDMFGALLTNPVHDEADIGVIFMDSGGYLNMCGHGSIGVSTIAVETGLVAVTEPYTDVVLDAPAGMIRARVKVENKKAVEVSFLNVPAFLYKENLEIKVEGFGKIKLDISFGGSFFALVDTEKLGIEINIENIVRLKDLGMRLLPAINSEIEIKHPYLDITSVDLVEFYGKSKNPKADLQNVVIFGDGQVDRSPCGTGTSAKIAYLYAKGKLKLGQEFVYESITGSLFRGQATKEMEIAGKKAIIPQITGSAYITGMNQWIIDEDDMLAYGFVMDKVVPKPKKNEKELIVKAIWELFELIDYQDVIIEDVIDRAGVSKEVFFKYYKNKDELLFSLSDLLDQRYAELMITMDDKMTALQKLVYINHELCQMIEEKIPLCIISYLYSSQMIANGDKHLLNQDRLYYKLVYQIMEEGKASGEFSETEKTEELVREYALIEHGLLYDWCINQGKFSLLKTCDKVMPNFLAALQA